MAKSIGRLNHEHERQFFNLINDVLKKDFRHISAWTFVRKAAGMIDEYIVDSEDYVGIGSGSFSYIHGSLYVNTFSTKQYSEFLTQGRSPLNARQEYSLFPRMRYWFLMNLFGMDFSPQKFEQRFNNNISLVLFFEMLFLRMTGAFQRNSYQLTSKGQYLSVVMMREFFAGVNNFRDAARKALSTDELTDQCIEDFGPRNY